MVAIPNRSDRRRSMTNAPDKKALKELEIALENRRFEISLFWQRANYFLVLNTALAIGAYSVSKVFISILICGFGVFVSALWFRTNIGAKFWQQFWEEEVTRLATGMDLSAMAESEESIRKRALSWTVDAASPWHKKYVQKRMITLKPEVSHNMILLSLISTWVWAGLIVIQVAWVMYKFCACSQ